MINRSQTEPARAHRRSIRRLFWERRQLPYDDPTAHHRTTFTDTTFFDHRFTRLCEVRRTAPLHTGPTQRSFW